MEDRLKKFIKNLDEFPEEARGILETIPHQAGCLSARQSRDLVDLLGIDLEELIVRLLPLARVYAVAPVSRFQVGAVAMAGAPSDPDQINLYLGANIEFQHQDLNQTIHAEQSATVNAWHQSAQYLYAVAVSEPPCGHCRQFLNEFEKQGELVVITPVRNNLKYRKILLSNLLPEAFGPIDLGNRVGLMANTPQTPRLRLKTPMDDATIIEALLAAEKSYAPYTMNFTGCAIQTGTGEIYRGRYVETAAYNPSLTPLQSAILCMNMAMIEPDRIIRRVVMVEKPTIISQRRAVEILLGSWAHEIELEYFEAES